MIGLAIHEKAEDVILKQTQMEHYTVMPFCYADSSFDIKKVPYLVIVDTHGNIVFKGHPAKRNLQKDIDTLLNNGRLDLQTSTQQINSAIWKFKTESLNLMF